MPLEFPKPNDVLEMWNLFYFKVVKCTLNGWKSSLMSSWVWINFGDWISNLVVWNTVHLRAELLLHWCGHFSLCYSQSYSKLFGLILFPVKLVSLSLSLYLYFNCVFSKYLFFMWDWLFYITIIIIPWENWVCRFFPFLLNGLSWGFIITHSEFIISCLIMIKFRKIVLLVLNVRMHDICI